VVEKRERGKGKREKGNGKREKGNGKREKGKGKREKGKGKREKGKGKRKLILLILEARVDTEDQDADKEDTTEAIETIGV
jgi:hypothetical protein